MCVYICIYVCVYICVCVYMCVCVCVCVCIKKPHIHQQLSPSPLGWSLAAISICFLCLDLPILDVSYEQNPIRCDLFKKFLL